MRFAAANNFSAADYAAAGRSAANSLVSSFAAARRNAPDWTGLARTSMNTRSAERQTAMKAEADVATAGIQAFGNVKTTQIKGAYEHAAFKTKLDAAQKSRKAGRLGALGGFKMPKKPRKKATLTQEQIDAQIGVMENSLNEMQNRPGFESKPYDPNNIYDGGVGDTPSTQQQKHHQQQTPPTNPSSPPVATEAPQQAATPAAASVGPVNPGRQQAYNKILKIAQANPNIKFPNAVAAQSMHETGFLSDTGVYKATNYTNPFGQTGDRGWGTIPRKGFSDGWTLYPDLETAVNDHGKLWHDTKNHSQNYNAHATIRDGIAAVAPAYSPDADPVNIRKGYTVDAYSKNMTKILNQYGGIKL